MYGRLQPSQMGQGIEILFANPGWRRASGDVAPATRRLIRPVGDVAGLAIGSRWIDGVSAAIDDKVQTVVIDVPALDGWPKHQLGEASFKPEHRAVYPTVGMQDAPVWRMPIGDHTYFVPAGELIRAAFGSTTDLLRLAIEGGLELGPSKRRMVVDLGASGRDRSDPSVIRIKAHRTLQRREAELIGRILTNERMRRSFMQVFASIQRAGVNGRPLYPTTLFPFDQPTQWTVDTAWTWVNGQSRRCLITRIRSIKTQPLTFKKIIVELAGNAGELGMEEAPRRVPIKIPGSTAGNIEMAPHRAPVSNVATIALVGGHTSHEPGFSLEHMVTDASRRQSTVSLPEEDNEPWEIGSTYHGAGRKGGAVGVSFQSTVIDYDDHPREAGALIDSTRRALETYARKKDWPCELVSPHFGAGADPIDGLFRYPPHANGRPLNWSKMAASELRRALVMRLTTPTGNIYAVDAESKGTTDKHALGLILTSPRDVLDYEDIQDILAINAAHRGVWGLQTSGYVTVKLARNATWLTDIRAYSSGLFTPISALLSMASSES